MILDENIIRKWENIPVQCPECGKMSRSIKSYRIPENVFVLIFPLKGGYTEYITCNECMRRIVLRKAPLSILKSNLMSPIATLPWLLVNFYRSFISGHSADIIARLEENDMRSRYTHTDIFSGEE